jgi:mitochondrial fission protein ELM1
MVNASQPLDLERTTQAQPPRVWVLTTKKLGDNAQVRAIADALGWPYELKHLEFTGVNHFHFRVFGPSLWKVAVDRSSPLVPPWPDLLLTIGRRSTPLALWVRQQSGNKTRLVQVGQSRVGFACFDLVIGNPQNQMPAKPNLIRLGLPLLYGNSATASTAVAQWQPRFIDLPKPWTALLIGGSAAPVILDIEVARRMMEEVRQIITREGGSLLVTTSRRTSREVADIIEAGMPATGFFHRWAPDGQSNPYPAILGLADRFIVTGESISMLTEVVRRGKPLAIYPLPYRRKSVRLWYLHVLQSLLFPPGKAAKESGGWREGLGDRLVHLGLLQYRRDFSLFHQQLIARGLAVRLGAPFLPVQGPPPDDLPMVIERIKMLFENRPTGGKNHPCNAAYQTGSMSNR